MTYEDLVSLLERVREQPDLRGPDVFADHKLDGETGRQAKSRTMLDYSLEGRSVRDADLWALRAQYVSMKQYVQIDGKPYSTHNPLHFTNRYGMGGARVQMIQLGIFKGTPEAMMVECARECAAREALRLLS
jgi:hypothetical protein